MQKKNGKKFQINPKLETKGKENVKEQKWRTERRRLTEKNKDWKKSGRKEKVSCSASC